MDSDQDQNGEEIEDTEKMMQQTTNQQPIRSIYANHAMNQFFGSDVISR